MAGLTLLMIVKVEGSKGERVSSADQCLLDLQRWFCGTVDLARRV